MLKLGDTKRKAIFENISWFYGSEKEVSMWLFLLDSLSLNTDSINLGASVWTVQVQRKAPWLFKYLKFEHTSPKNF